MSVAADAGTIRRLRSLGVASGWRCLEVGAGGGSIVAYLCREVGPQGSVTAIDIDTRFVDEIDAANLDGWRQLNGWAGFERIYGICVSVDDTPRPRLEGKTASPASTGQADRREATR